MLKSIFNSFIRHTTKNIVVNVNASIALETPECDLGVKFSNNGHPPSHVTVIVLYLLLIIYIPFCNVTKD